MPGLGRRYERDERDYQLDRFLTADPLDAALEVLKSKPWRLSDFKDWATIITQRVQSLTPPPPDVPTPPAPTADVDWSNDQPTLDQGETPHCVGFSAANWGNTLPVGDQWTNDMGHELYYAAKEFDGEPREENGSTVRSGAKALKQKGRLTAYAFTTDLEVVRNFIQTKGPVMFGTNWHAEMFNPDSNGFVAPNGDIEGGHAFLAVGDMPSKGALLFENSWGAGWGMDGRFLIRYPDVMRLLEAQGEACAAVELPL